MILIYHGFTLCNSTKFQTTWLRPIIKFYTGHPYNTITKHDFLLAGFYSTLPTITWIYLWAPNEGFLNVNIGF